MADETNIDLQMEADLKDLFGKSSDPAKGTDPGETNNPPGTSPGSNEPPPSEESGTSDASDASDASDTSDVELSERDKQLKALADLTGEEPPKDDKTPQLSDDQQIILQHIPDRQTAERLVGIANNHVAFEETFRSGKLEDIEGMFQAFDKNAYSVFLDSIYAKYGEEFVRRYVEEHDPEQQHNKYANEQTRRLQREVEELKRANQERSQQNQQAQQRAQQEQIFKAYTGKIDELFNLVGVTDETDKKFIRRAVDAEVRGNKKVAGEIAAGNLRGLTVIFKTESTAYLQRDKQFNQKTAQKVKEQEKHKPPVGGGGGTVTTDSGPAHDFKNVKRGEEDATLTQRLQSLFASKKKR